MFLTVSITIRCFQRNLAQFAPFAFRALHHQKAAMHEQVPIVVRNFYDAANQLVYSLNPGSFRSPMGETLTWRAFDF